MTLPTYLSVSRHNIYYFRYPLPREMHPQHKIQHVRLSLRTSNHREAIATANMLSYHAETLVRTLRGTSMNYEQIRKTIKEGLGQLVNESQNARLQSGPMDKQLRLSTEHWLGMFERYNIEDYYEGDVVVSQAERKIAEVLPDLEIQKDQRETFNKEFIRQYPEAIKTILAFNANPEDVAFSNRDQNKEYQTRTPLKDSIEKYIDTMLRGNNWKLHTEKERRRNLGILTEILGENFVTESMNKKTAIKVEEIVTAMPVNMRGNKKTRNLKIEDAVKVEGIDKISVKTANEYLNAHSAFCEWLSSRSFIPENPFKGMKTKIKRTGKPKRDAFTLEALNTIQDAINQPDIKQHRKQFRYWGILIAMYTGARLEEICQLHLDDIVQQEEVWCFDINDNGDKKDVKNASSIRIIPIHQKLLDAGILEYAKDLGNKGYDRLFPELTYSENHGYGRPLSNWFNGTFLVHLGLKTDKQVFHSFRHSVATYLGETGAQDSIQKKILGHSMANDTTAGYDHSKRLTLMKEALEKLPY